MKRTRRLNTDLSPRETQVLELMVLGMSNDEIGESLSIKIETVKSHIKKVMAKRSERSRIKVIIKELKNRHMSKVLPVGRYE